MAPRWMIERKYESDRQLLQIVEIYAEKENKEVVIYTDVDCVVGIVFS